MTKYKKQYKKGLHIYTDGACRGNPGPGSWAMAVYDDFKYQGQKSGYLPSTTNNEAELTALLEALGFAKRMGCIVYIYTDSDYAKQGYKNWVNNWARRGWKTASGTPVKNMEIWKQIYALKAELTTKATIYHVKGHSGVEGNEKADAICNEVLDKELAV